MDLNLDKQKILRHQSFLEMLAAPRPLIGSWLFSFYYHELFPNLSNSIRPGPIQPSDLCVELFLKDIDQQCKTYTQLNDDYPLAAGTLYAVPWMEAIMGCPIYSSGTTMWADPCISDWETYNWEAQITHNPWYQKLLEFLQALIDHSGGRYTCSPTLMRGIADMCAAMRGSTTLAMDLYDNPQYVERLAELCADVWIDVAEAQLELIPESKNGYIVGCVALRCWMPEKGVWLQDDAASVLSPSFYKELFLPQVRRIASRFSHIAFHLHGTYLWLIDLLLDIEEIDVLELNYDIGIVQLDDIIPAWKKIQKKKPLIAFADVDHMKLEQLVNELPPVGLSIQTLAPTLEDGLRNRDLVYKLENASL